MIIIIILGVLLCLGIVGTICLKNSWKYDDLRFACILDILFSAIILIGCLTAILTVQLESSVNAENALAEKAMLEYRLSKDKDIAGNELLYSDIVEFNNELRSKKKWANNPWTNWFNNKKIADIDYIEVPDMVLEE